MSVYEKKNASGGKILQVIGKTITTQGSQMVPLGVDAQVGAGTDFILDIVTKGNNSNFLIECRWFGESEASWNTVFNVHRDGVRVNNAGIQKAGLSMATQTYDNPNNASTPEIMHMITLDKTGSTAGTPIQYKLVAASSVAPRRMWTNRCFGTAIGVEVGVSEIIITEIAA